MTAHFQTNVHAIFNMIKRSLDLWFGALLVVRDNEMVLVSVSYQENPKTSSYNHSHLFRDQRTKTKWSVRKFQTSDRTRMKNIKIDSGQAVCISLLSGTVALHSLDFVSEVSGLRIFGFFSRLIPWTLTRRCSWTLCLAWTVSFNSFKYRCSI